MTIIVYGINYYPELIGIGKYNTELCEYLAEKGHKVTVATGFPYYPEWKIRKPYNTKLFMVEECQGIKIRRSYVYVPRKVTPRTRILHELSFMVSSFFNLLFSRRSELLITISPPLGLGLVACAISRIKNIPFLFHVQDLQPDTAVEVGMLRSKPILRLLYKIEKLVYLQAARISVISNKMKEKIILKGISKQKVVYFPNWVDTECIKPMPKTNRFRKLNKLDDKFIVLYSGNIGIKQGWDVVLEVAKKTKDNKKISYVIAGDGVYKEELCGKYRKSGLENIIFLPLQPKEMLPYMLSAADICLIPQQRNVTDVTMPSKLLGMMASGRAVIAGANAGTELYNVLNDSGAGLIVEPENPEQLLEAIMKLYNEPQESEGYGKKARDYVVNHFSKINVLKSFERDVFTEFRVH